MEKFYQVVDEKGRAVEYRITDYDKAVRTAKKYAVQERADAFILTATQVVQAPVPEAEVTELK